MKATVTKAKKAAMDRLSTKEGVFAALAIDQRGALKKMMAALGVEADAEKISQFCWRMKKPAMMRLRRGVCLIY